MFTRENAKVTLDVSLATGYEIRHLIEMGPGKKKGSAGTTAGAACSLYVLILSIDSLASAVAAGCAVSTVFIGSVASANTTASAVSATFAASSASAAAVFTALAVPVLVISEALCRACRFFRYFCVCFVCCSLCRQCSFCFAGDPCTTNNQTKQVYTESRAWAQA